MREQGSSFTRIHFIAVFVLVLFALFALVACSEQTATPVRPTSSVTPSVTPAPTLTATSTPSPTAPPTATATATATATPSDLWIEPSGINVFPAGKVYTGDVVSFVVEVFNGSDEDYKDVPVRVDWGTDRASASIRFIAAGESASVELLWVWDTTFHSGAQTVSVLVDPAGVTVDPDRTNNLTSIQLDIGAQRPPNELGAEWVVVNSDCCRFHYITGTAAERDIDALVEIADEAVAYAEAQLELQQSDPLEIYLISRVLGHGGFAGKVIAISYLDRNYAGGGMLEVFRHEGVHILDRQITQGNRIPFLVEGFATYITGGHYFVKPLPERAAALLHSERYIPLNDLIGNFYPSQHETGYVQAGAFIAYLVERNGFDTFIEMYSELRHVDGESDVDVLDRELTETYDMGLEAMEAEWQQHLRSLDVESQRSDMLGTIKLYDTIRRYQQALDPSAYVWNAWIPDIQEAESRGLVSDYVRHPSDPENMAIETMLIAAEGALKSDLFDHADELLASINAVLDADGTFHDPVAARYLEVVQTSLASGYEPHQITIVGDKAEVLATHGGESNLLQLMASFEDDTWSLLQQ